MDGKPIEKVPHMGGFSAVLHRLGEARTYAIRAELNRIIDEMEPDSGTGLRTFSSSHLGSKLTPWQSPLDAIYHIAREMSGSAADEQDVQDRAAQFWGLFVWECIMNRDENWVFYDPNLSFDDPNREITGKVYFEREN